MGQWARYSYFSQSCVNAARARGAYYNEFIAAAGKLHLKSDAEFIKEIDVGDAETSATDKTFILDVPKAHMNVLPGQSATLVEWKWCNLL